jgi:hypothetical protein
MTTTLQHARDGLVSPAEAAAAAPVRKHHEPGGLAGSVRSPSMRARPASGCICR